MPIDMKVPPNVNATGKRDNREVVGSDHSPPARRLDGLELDYEMKWGRHQGLYDAVASYRAALGEAEGYLARVLDPARSLKGMSPEEIEAERDEAKSRKDRARRAYDGAVAQNREANSAQASARKTLARCQQLYSVSKGPLVTKPIKGDPVTEIARIEAEIARIEKAAPDPDTVIEGLMGKVDGWAKQATVRVGFGKNPDLYFPVTAIAAEPSGELLPNAPDIRPWLARFHRDALEKDIRAAVAAKYEDVELTMSESEKRTKLRDLKAQRLNADYHRCQAIWDAYAADPTRPLDFPADADPRAILGLSGPDIVLDEDRRD